jgi:FAD/FMN-containing dehydrogenase
MTSLAPDLAEITGDAHVHIDPDLIAGYLTDWTRRYHGLAACVVLPGSAAEVAAVVRYCAAHGIPLVPQGGNTGLVGGSVPPPAVPPPAVPPPAGPRSAGHGAPGGRDKPGAPGSRPDDLPVVLSTRRLTALDPVDTVAGQVTAGAGVTIARLRAHAAQAGFEYGVDLAARDSATVGGTIATNAGGIHVIRYGKTRAQLIGLTAVLADGSEVGDLAGLAAGTAGYDLTQLIAGSEGTLAVITAARLRLWPAGPPGAVVLAGVGGIAEAALLHAHIRAHAPGLLAAEYFEAAGLNLVRALAGLPLPLSREYPAYLLAELPCAVEDAGQLAEAALPADTAVAMDTRGRAALWAYRERLTEAISGIGVPHKIDVAVPQARLAAFRAGLDDVARQAWGGATSDAAGHTARDGSGGSARVASRSAEWKVFVFGHIGVGNLHVNVVGPDPEDDAVDVAVARLAAANDGSAAAEHGIGRAKVGWLDWSRPAGEITAMHAIKSALDPAGLFNPGVLFPSRPGT